MSNRTRMAGRGLVTVVNVRGTPIRATTLQAIVDELESLVSSDGRGYVCCASVHLVETARRDPEVAAALKNATAVLPDGAPVAWAARLQARLSVERITGSDLFTALCKHSAGRFRHFLYGSSPEVLRLLRQRMEAQFPGLEVCGEIAPIFGNQSEDERRAAIDRINAARPDVVWVGLGAPKQELWMRRSRSELDTPVLIGVGAVFDFVSGRKRRAPAAIRRFGLEWAFRLAQEPRRLWRRYLTTNLPFAFALARDVAGALWRGMLDAAA